MSLRIFYHPLYSALALPERHRFPLDKYQAASAIHWQRPSPPAAHR